MMTSAKFLSHGALVLALSAPALPATAASDKPSSCSVRDADASIRAMVPFERPELAAQLGLTGSAVVRIELDANGVAHKPAILQSSGTAILDAEALRAAMAQRYSPEIRSCEPISGTYRVVINFTGENER